MATEGVPGLAGTLRPPLRTALLCLALTLLTQADPSCLPLDRAAVLALEDLYAIASSKGLLGGGFDLGHGLRGLDHAGAVELLGLDADIERVVDDLEAHALL